MIFKKGKLIKIYVCRALWRAEGFSWSLDDLFRGMKRKLGRFFVREVLFN
jgi:hypothetical protein